MSQAFEELESATLSPEQCVAWIAMTKSYVANASETQANQEAAKPAEPLPETDLHLKAKLDQFRDQEAYQAQAEGIRDTFGGFVLTGCLSEIYEGRVEGGGYLAYVAATLEQARATDDPLERMMWAHHRIGVLHTQAAADTNSDRIEILTTAAARLMQEFRQAAMALQQYRTPTAKLNIEVEQPAPAAHAEPATVNGHKVSLPSGRNPRTELVPKINGNGKCPKNRLEMFLQPELGISGMISGRPKASRSCEPQFGSTNRGCGQLVRSQLLANAALPTTAVTARRAPCPNARLWPNWRMCALAPNAWRSCAS